MNLSRHSLLLTSILLSSSLIISGLPQTAEAGLRDRVRPIERPINTPGPGGIADPRGIGDPRGDNDPRSDNAERNQERRQDSFDENQDNRDDARDGDSDDREDAFEKNQDNREDTYERNQDEREDGREEYRDEAEDIADDIRDGEEIIDNGPLDDDELFDGDRLDETDFRGDGDGLIDGDGIEGDDNDLLKVMAVGTVIYHLPRNYTPIPYQGYNYYYADGYYYIENDNPAGDTYETVAAPVGLVISELPKGSQSQTVNNKLYYTCANTWYQATATGAYQVVAAP